MAGVKISELPDSGAGAGSDVVPVVQGLSTLKMTLAKILTYIQANIVIPTTINQSVEIFTLSPTDITNKYVTLAHTPTAAARVSAFVGGNTPGIYGDEFVMATATRLSWSGKTWQGLLVSGDKIVANYFY